jgi:nucleoside-diphosphate-sugar epimerase
MAAEVRPAAGWSEWLWCWVASVDAARAHRLVMEAALDKGSPLPPHDVFFCTSDDTSALEPSMELVERYRPELVPLVRKLEGYQSFMSSAKLKSVLGWRHETNWRRLLQQSS